MDTQDQQWAVRLIQRHVTGAKWVKVLKVGDVTFTVAVRTSGRCTTDAQVEEREAFLASLHPDVWEARLMRADADGETYHVTFSKLRQMSF